MLEKKLFVLKIGFFLFVFFLFIHRFVYANIIFQDNFHDQNGTELSQHNNQWIKLGFSGNGIIQNNQLTAPGNQNMEYVLNGISQSNLCAEININLPVPWSNPISFLGFKTRYAPDLSSSSFLGIDPNGQITWFDSSGSWTLSSPSNTGSHSLKECEIDNNHYVYFDNQLIKEFQSNSIIYSGTVGISSGWTGLFNSFTVSAFDGPSPDLPVPSLKQTSDPWQSQEYDGADLWSPKYPSINAWGCALTSATMIFEYYGLNKLPDGTPLDPGTLNTWLKNNNGYDDGVNNGYILPPTYARFSKLAAPANNVTAFDALETQVVPGNDKNQLTADLQATMPAMLGVVNNSHYVVAKGINGSTFDINDPYFDRNTLNDGYANTFISLTRFIPSHTDLSYMLFTTKSDITFSLKNSSGSAVGVQFIQPPLLSDPNGTPSGQASKVFLFQKPIAGQYTLTLTGTPGEKYQLNSYFYDKNGNIDTIKQSDVIGSTNENIYTVNFDQNIATKSAIFRNKGQKKSCEKLEEDIERFKQHHTIKAYLADVIIGLTHNMRCDKDDKHFHPFVPQYVWWFITLQKNQFSPQIFDTLHQDFNEIF